MYYANFISRDEKYVRYRVTLKPMRLIPVMPVKFSSSQEKNELTTSRYFRLPMRLFHLSPIWADEGEVNLSNNGAKPLNGSSRSAMIV